MDKPVFLAPTGQDNLLNHLLAPLFPRYRVLVELQKEPAHLRGPLRNLILSHDRRFLFLRNQKCACTQTTQLLYAYANNGATYPGNVHRANQGICPARYRWMDIKPVFQAHMSFFFTFVRDPQARVISAFHNFFVDQTNGARKKHMAPMRAHGYDPARDTGYNLDVFLDYVAHGFELDPINSDSHWRLQVHNIAWSDISYDFVGRVERYDADIAQIFAAGGALHFPPPELLKARHNRSTAPQAPITAARKARIEALYAPDYEAFGY